MKGGKNALTSQRSEQLNNFLFPCQQTTTFQTMKATTEVISKLMSTHHSDPSNYFFLALYSQTDPKDCELTSQSKSLLTNLNNNKFFYYFCFNIRDYLFQKKDSKGNLVYLVLPKYICIKSYIPNSAAFEAVLKTFSGITSSCRKGAGTEALAVEPDQGLH